MVTVTITIAPYLAKVYVRTLRTKSRTQIRKIAPLLLRQPLPQN